MNVDRNHYEVLGVSPAVSDRGLQAAYRDLAKAYHPDLHAAAGPLIQSRMQAAMAHVNEAYRVLSDPVLRREYDDALTESLRSRQQPRSTRKARHRWGDECEFCGSTPVSNVRLTQLTGLLVTRRIRLIEAGLCRTCGIEIFRSMTSRTLVTGWWGIISFFANALAIFRNVDEWNDLRRLDEPRRRNDAEILTPLQRPLAPGRPLWLRPGFLGFCAVVIAVALTTAQPPASSSSPPSRPAQVPTAPVPLPDDPVAEIEALEGSCLRYAADQTIDDVVPCFRDHDARVLAVRRTSAACPPNAPFYFVIPVDGTVRVLCVDR